MMKKIMARVPDDIVLEQYESRNKPIPLEKNTYYDGRYEMISYCVWSVYNGTSDLCDPYTRNEFDRSQFEIQKRTHCFSRIMNAKIEDGATAGDLCTFMAFWHNLDIGTVPCGQEYLERILNTPLARFLCYNVEEFLSGDGPLIMRVTPYNTAWYSIMGSIRHVREYYNFAERVITHMNEGYPMWLTLKTLSFTNDFIVSDGLIYVGNSSCTSHTILSSASPIVRASLYMGLNPARGQRAELSEVEKVIEISFISNSPLGEYKVRKGYRMNGLISNDYSTQMFSKQGGYEFLPEGVVKAQIEEMVNGNKTDYPVDSMPVSEEGWIDEA